MIKKIAIKILSIAIMILVLFGCKKAGKYYDLQEAYNQEIISKEELISIAYYWNKDYPYYEKSIGGEDLKKLEEDYENKIISTEEYESLSRVYKSFYNLKTYSLEEWEKGTQYNEEIMGENYTPIVKKPSKLSNMAIRKLKKQYCIYTKEFADLMQLRYPGYESREFTMDDIKAIDYFGTYDNKIIVNIIIPTRNPINELYGEEEHYYLRNIDGVNFILKASEYFLMVYCE